MTREEYIASMRPTPKKSTTSYCSSGNGGVTPVRVEDQRERKAILARMNPVSPDKISGERWAEWERQWDERIRESDRQAREATQERIRRSEEFERRQREQQERRSAFETAEAIVELALSELSADEKSSAYQQLTNENRVHDAERAGAIAQALIANRESVNSTRQSGLRVDWRGVITEEKR
jgi:hypothetical protein